MAYMSYTAYTAQTMHPARYKPYTLSSDYIDSIRSFCSRLVEVVDNITFGVSYFVV
jgi:hypothetical protein